MAPVQDRPALQGWDSAHPAVLRTAKREVVHRIVEPRAEAARLLEQHQVGGGGELWPARLVGTSLRGIELQTGLWRLKLLRIKLRTSLRSIIRRVGTLGAELIALR